MQKPPPTDGERGFSAAPARRATTEAPEDFPALFAAPAAKPPRVDVAERAAAPGGRKLSSAERIAQQVLQA